VVLDWQTGNEEPAFLAAAALRFGRYFDRSGCAEMKLNPELLADPLAFLARKRDTSHPAGGMCMSAQPTDGATDPEGRIWGASNVYVAGAAALATSGEANITLTALALALRLTDRISAISAPRLAA
jgi:choline dehydrogenase-like flavoprotein